jgi:hypothetical protein
VVVSPSDRFRGGLSSVPDSASDAASAQSASSSSGNDFFSRWKKFWPETGVNYTRYYLGPHGGNTSVYLTPGIVLGKFHLWDRLAFTVGGGYEIAVTSFHPTNHIAICSVRFQF